MKIVGITGRAGSGKSTAAKVIESLIPGAVTLSLADPIKEFAEAVFLFPHAWLYGPSELRASQLPHDLNYWPETLARFWNLGGSFLREWEQAIGRRSLAGSDFVDWFDRTRRECENDPAKLTPRHICQQLGTGFGRACLGADVWVAMTMIRAKSSLAPVVVVPDVRFDNEAQAVRNGSGLLLRIQGRAELNNWAGKLSPLHPSEAGVDPKFVSWIVPNGGSIEDLKVEIAEVFNVVGWLGD